MKTKPFNLEEYLADPSKKVVTRDGKNVRIICTDGPNEEFPIWGFIEKLESQVPHSWNIDGFYWKDCGNDENDLSFLDESEELTEFEYAVGLEIFDPPFNEEQIEVIKVESSVLLDIARKQIYEEFKDFTKLPKEE